MTPNSTEERVVLVEDFLAELDGWERAYPLASFPEPDLAKAAALLKAGGMTLDAVSASNMRHVVSKIAPKARAVIEALTRTDNDVSGLVEALERIAEGTTTVPDEDTGTDVEVSMDEDELSGIARDALAKHSNPKGGEA